MGMENPRIMTLQSIHFRRMIALATKRFNPNALVNKGNSLFVKENYAEAKELYLKAIGVDSTNFEAIYNLGLVNARLGLIPEAVHAFKRLHSIST